MELSAPVGYMRQSLPGQLCNDSVVIRVAEDLGAIGEFCPQGAIQKLQIHFCNVTVTVTHSEGKSLSKFMMSAMIKEEISGKRMIQID